MGVSPRTDGFTIVENKPQQGSAGFAAAAPAGPVDRDLRLFAFDFAVAPVSDRRILWCSPRPAGGTENALHHNLQNSLGVISFIGNKECVTIAQITRQLTGPRLRMPAEGSRT